MSPANADRSGIDMACARELLAMLMPPARRAAAPRCGYSQQENAAIAAVVEKAAALGMQGYADLAGNVYLFFPGSMGSARVALMGAQLDGVSAAGVAGALAVCGAAANKHVVLALFRAEDAACFAQGGIGSALALGAFPVESLAALTHAVDGRALAAHMEGCGVNVYKLKEGVPLLPAGRVTRFIALQDAPSPMAEAFAQAGVASGRLAIAPGEEMDTALEALAVWCRAEVQDAGGGAPSFLEALVALGAERIVVEAYAADSDG